MHLIITNNRKVQKEHENILFVDGDFEEVLIKTRDLIYQGHKLLTHPLPPSSRMFFSPVRSVVIKKEKTSLDEYSADVIGKSMELYLKHLGLKEPDHRNREDYERIDDNLLRGAMDELDRMNL